MHAAVGAHYDVGSQVSAADAAERLALLESAWPQFVRFCGREPKLAGPLKVRVYTTNDLMQKGMQAEDAGGNSDQLALYVRATKAVYVRTDWGPPFVRRRMVEECTLQFLDHLAQHKLRMPSWCLTGVMRHLGTHAFDGKQTELGIVMPLSLENDAKQALDRVAAKDFDYRRLLATARGEDAIVHHAAVRVLATDPDYRKKFQSLLPRLEKGLDVSEHTWAAHFGPYEKFEKALRASLRDAQEPFAVGHLHWDAARIDRDPATGERSYDLRCHAGLVVSCSPVVEPVKALRATIRIPPGTNRMGLVLDWIGPNDYRILLFRPDGYYEVQSLGPKGWQFHGNGQLAVTDGAMGERKFMVEAATGADGSPAARVLVDGQQLLITPVRNTRFGVVADCGVAIVRNITLTR